MIIVRFALVFLAIYDFAIDFCQKCSWLFRKVCRGFMHILATRTTTTA